MSRTYRMNPCPKCNEPSKVLRASETVRGTARRRKCSGCGFEFPTLEVVLCGPSIAGNAIPAHLILEALEMVGIPIDKSNGD